MALVMLELFHDLGFIGLIIGGILTGYLIQIFSKMMGSKSFYLIFKFNYN